MTLPGHREDILSRLQKLKDPTGTVGATEAPAAPDEAAQAAARLTAAARDLEALLGRWEQRLTKLEKDADQATAGLVQRLDGRVTRVLAEAYALAVAWWWKRQTMIFVCGVVLGMLLAFGVPYVWHSQALAEETHDVLKQILENNRKAQEEAKAVASPKPPTRGR